MRVEFLGQPFPACPTGRETLIEWLTECDKFWALVAWSQLGGLKLLEESLRKFTARGGQSQIILGIDQGIATREGLALAIELFSTAYVFHDPTGRTFHPKVYCAEKGTSCQVLLGSGNLTEGGLSNSYEAGLVLDLDRSRLGDAEVYDDILDYWSELQATGMPCRKLTPELLAQMSKIPRLITTETARRAAQRRTASSRGQRAAIFKLFNPPAAGRLAPRAPRQATRLRANVGPAKLVESSAPTWGTKGEPLHWSKKLTASDAVRKPKGSHQRNYVVLGQAGHPIDRNTWFRDELFGSAEWQTASMKKPSRSNAKQKEIANLNVRVLVDNKDIGQVALRVEHAMHRLSNQKNAPTWLHWSGLLPMVKERSFRGWYLTLERLVSGELQVRLDPKPPK